jgi:hypothetical protein
MELEILSGQPCRGTALGARCQFLDELGCVVTEVPRQPADPATTVSRALKTGFAMDYDISDIVAAKPVWQMGSGVCAWCRRARFGRYL